MHENPVNVVCKNTGFPRSTAEYLRGEHHEVLPVRRDAFDRACEEGAHGPLGGQEPHPRTPCDQVMKMLQRLSVHPHDGKKTYWFGVGGSVHLCDQ